MISERYGIAERYCSKTCSGIDHRRPFDKELVHRTVIKDENGCWLWNRSGRHCCAWINGKVSSVHRAVYELFVGPIPDGLQVCHHCDVPNCCNPKHLFLGTQKDNMIDCAIKGRVVTPFKRKLTEAKVIEIRQLYANGWSHPEIARRFSVTRESIRDICKRKNWRHV